MLPAGSISTTRLLNWSVIRIFPGWLKPLVVTVAVLTANTDGKAASERNTTASARILFCEDKDMSSCPPYFSKVRSGWYYHNSLFIHEHAQFIASRLQTYS